MFLIWECLWWENPVFQNWEKLNELALIQPSFSERIKHDSQKSFFLIVLTLRMRKCGIFSQFKRKTPGPEGIVNFFTWGIAQYFSRYSQRYSQGVIELTVTEEQAIEEYKACIAEGVRGNTRRLIETFFMIQTKELGTAATLGEPESLWSRIKSSPDGVHHYWTGRYVCRCNM